ncbi:hypothetical protein N7468_002677 [Penicillium chermesinum]|uniref:AMP-dependent synthetase/ligase domain-containing protein n=1 Tax=Penicillium chermesinum TaxID=63820 RepID=A0A9W9PJ60_9EURO|nr:uncharacterized protein N7468_002677 [Penicillium chermesinum]KAJ5247694.1 hypothetical protein N7468_002677 [Penicillium chermesinum]
MAPSLIEPQIITQNPVKGPLKTQLSALPNQDVDLTLTQRPQNLLCLLELLDVPSDIRYEHSDVQLQRLLQWAWAITIRAFTSSNSIFVGENYLEGCSFVGDSPPADVKTAQVHLDTQDPIQELFSSITSSLKVQQLENKERGSGGQESHFNTTVIYQREPAQRNGDGLAACSGACTACCPVPIVVSEPESSADGLRLYIRRTPDSYFEAKLDVGRTPISLPLATSLLHSFNRALSSIREAPSQTISSVDLCSPHDRRQIAKLAESHSPAQNVLLHDLFLQHVKDTPDALAIRSWDGDFTYAELNRLSCRLAHWLAEQGVRPGIFVACAFYKSTWAIVARLAVLMAGGAYICVDAHDPPGYLASVLERTGIKIMLTSTGFAQKFGEAVETYFEVCKESVEELPSQATPPASTVTPTDPCVVLFTSGSTGTPKGIIQEHRSYASALTDLIRVMGMGPHTRLFQFDAYAFDISNNDFLAPLIAGGCCCVPTPSQTVEMLMQDLNMLEANTTFATPSVAIDIDPERVPTLQTMCIGGEPISDAVLTKWMGRVRVINQYGMGEVASLCAFNANLQIGRGAVVGRPASGAIWIVNPDSADQLMPVGAVGELLVEGPHISRGYLDHVSGKSENFLATPPQWMAALDINRESYRFYRSGDLGRYNHDGTIELIGRKDTMLKLDGTRVEASQVEYVLRHELSTGDAAVVDVVGSADGVCEPILIVYLFLSNNPMNLESGPIEDMQFRPVTDRHAIHRLTQSLADAVRRNLPSYYVPSLFLLVDRVPRTKSKKTDRRKLHMLGQAYYMAHREELRDITVWPDWE